VFPVSLVICNDCFAFFCGKLFGRKFVKTPFLRLSPNKTWEGFIGAFVCTMVFGFFVSAWLSKVRSPRLLLRAWSLRVLTRRAVCLDSSNG
jgi:CDP-diglyceride synthetase